jgi:hypothetical protein
MATISSLLRDRVSLQVRSVDRIFLAANMPRLQSEGLLVRFLLDRGFSIPSPALLGKISQGYVRAIERFAAKQKIPMVHFKRGESKEQVARRYMQQAERDGRFGVVMIGVAQEKASAWRGFRAGGSAAHPHFSYRRMSVFPNHYYFYIRDAERGPGFVKTVGYAPFPVWIYLIGHEWAKRQAERRGISFQALDSGFRSRVRPQDHRPHPRPVSHPGDHPRRRAPDPSPLQALQGQAVLQRRPGAQNRDHHQRPL